MGASLTKEICGAVIRTHREYGWRAEKECLFSLRRIDVLAISPRAHHVIGYEIKSSLQDFRSELSTPAKRGAVTPYCTFRLLADSIAERVRTDVTTEQLHPTAELIYLADHPQFLGDLYVWSEP